MEFNGGEGEILEGVGFNYSGNHGNPVDENIPIEKPNFPDLLQYTGITDPKKRWGLIKGLEFRMCSGIHEGIVFRVSEITGEKIPVERRLSNEDYNGILEGFLNSVLKVEKNEDIKRAIEMRLVFYTDMIRDPNNPRFWCL